MASKSLNRVVLMGNLTRDPELKYTPQGTAVCTFGLATNRGWTTATGEIKEDVQYHRIVAWQKLAELCAQLLKKGRKVYLEGRIVYRTYTGKDGQERQSTEIIMSDFIVFDDRRTGDTVTMTSPEKAKVDDTEFSVEDLAAIDSEAEDTSKITSDDMPF